MKLRWRGAALRCEEGMMRRRMMTLPHVRIGGFALVTAPAEYAVTGVKTFIVSHDGVVYEKNFGAQTLDEFMKMESFNPDKSWAPVPDEDQ
jgi:hypothetical protein